VKELNVAAQTKLMSFSEDSAAKPMMTSEGFVSPADVHNSGLEPVGPISRGSTGSRNTPNGVANMPASGIMSECGGLGRPGFSFKIEGATQPEAFPDDGCHNVCSPSTDGKQSIVLSPHEILNRHAASGTEGRDGGPKVDEVEDLG